MLDGGTVEPISLRNQVADLIKDAMLSGKLKPGQRIVELRLAKELGLGTTSIREALFQLERQGYVTRVLNKGAYVTELSPEDRRQIYTVRMELEGLSAQLAAERRENLSLDPLQLALDEMKSAAGSGNLERFYECDLKFHRTVWKLGNNRYAIQFLESIVAPLFGFYVMRTHRNAKQLTHEVEIHRAILDAIRLEAPSQARQVMREKLHYYLGQEALFLS
jgi:DNA-binding GntR family transcriptional regulator